MKWKVAVGGAALVLALLAIALGLARFNASNAGWGNGSLKIAERQYYVGRVARVADAWKDLARQMKRDGQGRVEDPSFTCLVIDTAEKRLWLERSGQPLAEYEAGLPSRLDWQLFHDTPNGVTELGPLARLRIPGLHTNRQRHELVRLVGVRDHEETLYFSFDPSGNAGRGYGGGTMRWQSQWNSQDGKTVAEAAYESFLVTDSAYEVAKEQFESTGVLLPQADTLRDNRLAWMHAEKTLLQEMDRLVRRQGLDLSSLTLTCGPDYTAASAELGGHRSGWLSALRRESASTQAYLRIDSLGNDVWYLSSAAHPHHSRPPGLSLDMESLVSATGPIAKDDREALLAEGRQKQQTQAIPTTP